MTVDYQAPARPRRARDIPDRDRVRDCTSCRRTIPVDQFYHRFKGDPFGVGDNAAARYKRAERKAGRKATPEGTAAAAQFALNLPVPGNRMLRLQPRCIACETARAGRKAQANQLRSDGFTVDLDGDDAFSARVTPAPHAALLERSAAAGLVIVDGAGLPVLPENPVEALRVCYAGLLAIVPEVKAKPATKTSPEVKGKPAHPARPGYLGDDRVGLLYAIDDLVAAADGHAITKRADDVIDCALVRDGGPTASDGMARLLERHLPFLSRRTRARVATQVKIGLLTREEAHARFDEGVFLAALKWDPLHHSCAAFATVANSWAARQAEVRTRGEHWVGQKKDGATGHWGAPAAALVRDSQTEGDSSYEVHAGSYTHGTQPLRVDAEGVEVDRVQTIKDDVTTALAKLDPVDREIVTRRLLGRENWNRIAADLGMTSREVKLILADCKTVLQKVLGVHYEGVTS